MYFFAGILPTLGPLVPLLISRVVTIVKQTTSYGSTSWLGNFRSQSGGSEKTGASAKDSATGWTEIQDGVPLTKYKT
jgi:hypothetical protein